MNHATINLCSIGKQEVLTHEMMDILLVSIVDQSLIIIKIEPVGALGIHQL